MRLKRAIAASALVAVVIGVAGCSVRNVEVHGAYAGAGMREELPPVTVMMYNNALAAMELPAGAVAGGDYVAVYRLASGAAGDQWWCYLTEDALVGKIKAAGATPVERNPAAAGMLAREGDLFPPPKTGKTVADVSPTAKENKVTLYRATRALAYRVVAADVWFSRPHKTGSREATVRAAAEVVVNLRTLDVATGEVLWSGTVKGTTSQDVPVSWVTPWYCWDWDDWDDDEAFYGFKWYDDDEGVYIGPMNPHPAAPPPAGTP